MTSTLELYRRIGRRAEEQKKQARREELLGMLGAGLFGLMVGGMLLLYSINY